MTQRGGRRPGAGRKKGVPNKIKQEERQAIAESGLTPLDYMLSVMRDEANDLTTRMDAAHKAAPYVHSKLANIEHSGQVGLTVTLEQDAADL